MLAHWVEVWPLVVLGFLGSLHCIGMCGGFAIAVTAGGDGEGGGLGRLVSRQGTYLAGKACSYAILAALLATGLAWLGGDGGDGGPHPGLVLARRGLSVLAGAALVATGVAMLLRKPLSSDLFGGRVRRGIERVSGPARKLLDGTRALPPRSRAFGIGVLNGLLPCGLSWAAVLVAAQHAPHVAAVAAFAFGLATGPALVAVGVGARLAASRGRAPVLGAALVGTALIVFGALTVLRGDLGAGLDATHAAPACCAD